MTEEQFDDYADYDDDESPIGADCDDQNALVNPSAHDFRGDGCDADCGAEVDADGDDWPASIDCDDDNPDIYPCAPEVDGDGIDSDCDELDSVRAGTCDVLDPDAVLAGEQTPQLTRDCQFIGMVGQIDTGM